MSVIYKKSRTAKQILTKFKLRIPSHYLSTHSIFLTSGQKCQTFCKKTTLISPPASDLEVSTPESHAHETMRGIPVMSSSRQITPPMRRALVPNSSDVNGAICKGQKPYPDGTKSLLQILMLLIKQHSRIQNLDAITRVTYELARHM
jgi:hypothetical protein